MNPLKPLLKIYNEVKLYRKIVKSETYLEYKKAMKYGNEPLAQAILEYMIPPEELAYFKRAYHYDHKIFRG